MPGYAYTGLSAAGKNVKGTETAESVAALKAALKRKGIYLTAVTETGAGGMAAQASSDEGATEIDLGKLFDRIKPKDVARVTRLMSTLLIAGVTLPEALSALTDQVESERFKGILSDLSSKVNEGSALADAMSAHPKVFSDLYINMIRAGEASGSLETVLIRLADFMEQEEELKGKILQAMIYPAAMMVVGGFVVALLMIKVVPNISQMFEDEGAELPKSTQMLIWISGYFVGYGEEQVMRIALRVSLTFALLGVGIWGLSRYLKTAPGRLVRDTLMLKLPVVGELARKVAVARFARTLSTMLASGVQLLQALDIVKSLLGNVVLEKVVTEARDNIREGEGVAPALKRSGQFPPLVTHMIAVGERSGQLEKMLTELADAYDRETQDAIARMTAVLEPIMIVGMGGVVAFIVFSVMRPILQMNSFGGG